MKMKFFLTALAIVILSGSARAQKKEENGNGKISGIVTDGSSKVLESATITLIRISDSAVVRMSAADKTGHYAFDNVPAGNYRVSVTATGHQPAWSAPVAIIAGGTEQKLEAIDLVPAVKTVAGVTVVSKKPLIEQKPDRTVVNVDAAITNVGKTALEVLEKSPGITVDKDGNVSLKGKTGVVILIDGRPSYLSGADLAALLRSMSAAQLDQIEIMTNPPARFDASGNAGVINIKTKKNRQYGYSGSISTGYTQGYYPRTNQSLTFNYRNKKLNCFSNFTYNRNERHEKLDIDRNFRESATKDIVSVFEQQSVMRNTNNYQGGKIGADFTASKKTTLGIVLNGYRNPSTWTSQSFTNIFNPAHQLTGKSSAWSQNKEQWHQLSANFNTRTAFDSTGQELTTDWDYVHYHSSADQPLVSSYYDAAGNLKQTPDTLMGYLPQDIQIYSGKADYVKPLKKGAKLEAGWKSSYVKTDNDARYDSIRNGQPIQDLNRSNHFLYSENINAAYVNYNRPLGKKWEGQFGLRLENTHAKGDQLTTHIRFTRQYTQLFPTVYLQYKASDKNSFVVNYGRRINRPDYGDLNPFIHFIDRYTFEQGNPDLKPQFSHNIELSHTYNQFLTTTLNYSRTTDIIQQVIEQNENTNETYIKRANIASQNQVGLTVTAFKQIRKWWSGSVYANYAWSRFKGIVSQEQVSVSVGTFIIQSQQQFKWGKGWAAEVSGFYRTKGLEGVIFIKPIIQLTTGFSKQILKNKASVRLNVDDVLQTSVFRGYSRYSNVDAQFTSNNFRRSVSLGFTWRFNKGKLNASGSRKQGGAGDEEGRVKH